MKLTSGRGGQQTKRPGRTVIRKLIWSLVGSLALGVVALMIVTPTPPADGGLTDFFLGITKFLGLA